jgi:hypothetical protein
MVVSGDYFHGKAHSSLHSYFFSRYNHCWGWATWRRAWSQYDIQMKHWPALKQTDWLLSLADGNERFRRYWTRIFDTAHAGKVNTWDYPWTFSCWAQSGLSILPARNLVSNIGFDTEATHTTSHDDPVAGLPLEEMAFPLVHPDCVIRDAAADQWSDRHHFNISFASEMKQAVYNVPGGNMLRRLARSFKR